MAITYNVAKCKRGWGVYLRALSGDELRVLFPNLGSPAAKLVSGRITRRRSKQSAKNFINRIKREPIEEQLSRILNTHIRIVDSDYQIVKTQNLTVFRELSTDNFIPQLTTTNKTYAENLALYYSEKNKKSFLRKGATKYLKIPLNIEIDNLNKI